MSLGTVSFLRYLGFTYVGINPVRSWCTCGPEIRIHILLPQGDDDTTRKLRFRRSESGTCPQSKESEVRCYAMIALYIAPCMYTCPPKLQPTPCKYNQERPPYRRSSCALGTAFCIRSHSPLNALTSQELSSAALVSSYYYTDTQGTALTIVNNLVRIVEVDAVVGVGKEVHVVVFHAREVELVEQGGCVLHVHVVVCDAVHDEEAYVLREGFYVVD